MQRRSLRARKMDDEKLTLSRKADPHTMFYSQSVSALGPDCVKTQAREYY